MAEPPWSKFVRRIILLQATAEGAMNAVLLFERKCKKKLKKIAYSWCCPCPTRCRT